MLALMPEFKHMATMMATTSGQFGPEPAKLSVPQRGVEPLTFRLGGERCYAQIPPDPLVLSAKPGQWRT